MQTKTQPLEQKAIQTPIALPRTARPSGLQTPMQTSRGHLRNAGIVINTNLHIRFTTRKVTGLIQKMVAETQNGGVFMLL